MWFLLLLLHGAGIQAVTSKAAVRVILRSEAGPCEGHVEAYYNDIWGHVGDSAWARSTEEVVCRSTFCGEPVENTTVSIPKRMDKVWLNDLRCSGQEKDLLDCSSPGLGISVHPKPFVKKIKCSNKIQLSLEGSRCSGAVRYSINEGSDTGYFCSNNWGEYEAGLLCKNLGCGGFAEFPVTGRFPPTNLSPKMQINCPSSGVTHLWQCVRPDSPQGCQSLAAVTCTGHRRLQLTGSPSNVCSGRLEKKKGTKWIPASVNSSNSNQNCQKMHCGTFGSIGPDNQLTCSDNISIVLIDRGQESKCYGTVHFKRNGSIYPVCATTWTLAEDKMVCRELGCGEVASRYTIPPEFPERGGIDFVECKDDESSLWHCRALHGRDVRCSSTPYIICSESVDVKLVDGPDRCAGTLTIHHEGQWKRVANLGWKLEYSNTVCQQLKCRNAQNLEEFGKFSKGSGTLLSVQCQPQTTTISQCALTNQFPLDDTDVVQITCEAHKVVFLRGTQPCSGEVMIEDMTKTYQLSGSVLWNQESANAVCRQMHCGTAVDFTTKARGDVTQELWATAYNCSSTDKSLFECIETNLPSEDLNTTASVTCSGNRNVSLTQGCWGRVVVCSEGECGGVCGDTWTSNKSSMLCESLGCGRELQTLRPPESGNIKFKSLQTTRHTTDLSHCNLIKNEKDDHSCDQNPASVVCSESIKTRFEGTRDKCSGNVVVDYDGTSVPICSEVLSNVTTQNVICGELNCGSALRTLPYFGRMRVSPFAVSEVKCPAGSAGSLSACTVNPEESICQYGGLQCSDWRMMSFQETCSGEVFVLSEGKKHLVSSEGWNDREGQRLCEDMKCGNFESMEESLPNPDEVNSFWNRSFSCGGEIVSNIWDCETQAPPGEMKKLLVTCQDESKISLSQQCHGELRIGNTAVCDNNWKVEYSHMVCHELECGNAIVDAAQRNLPVPAKTYHVSCDKHHYELGQCRRLEESCSRESVVSVYCVDSIQFNTSQHCGGELKVKYDQEWQSVCMPEELPQEMKVKLCKELKCGSYKGNIISRRQTKKEKLEVTLQCSQETFDIKYCVKRQSCENSVPAEIYCTGFVEQVVAPEEKSFSVGLIVGVVIVVILLVMLALFGFCFIKRAKKSNVLLKNLPNKETEFESGNYEDLKHGDSDIEDISSDRSRPGPGVTTEPDARSTSSYDDVDGTVESQPLTDAAAGTRETDEVTYEGNDSLEGYDDIGLDETEAEVHQSPKAGRQGNDEEAPRLQQQHEEYLVSGEDG